MKPLIVAFSGAARVGKDTSADAPCFLKGWRRVSFAEALKADVFAAITRAKKKDPLCIGCPPHVSWFNDPVRKEVLRPLLVAYGATMRKISPGHWIRRMEDASFLPHVGQWTKGFVITDLRYRDEAEWVREHGGIVITLQRPGHAPVNAEEERSLSEFTGDYVITNSGSKEDLWDKVACVLNEYTARKEQEK